VLIRFLRETWGWSGRDRCRLGYGRIAQLAGIARSRAQKAVELLIHRGYIERIPGENNPDGAEYRVLLRGIPPRGIPSEEQTMPSEGTLPPHGIPPRGNIEKKNKDFKTHTNTEGVSARSHFTLKECRAYADHLHKSGQGIEKPGGYATIIHRTGEADELIEQFLNPPAKIDFSDCEECNGTGYYYPDGFDKGAKKCPHSKLKNAG